MENIKLEAMRDLTDIKNLAIETLAKSSEEQNVDQRQTLDKELNEIIKHYASVSKLNVYAEARKAANPMHELIRVFYYPTIKVKTEKDQATDLETRTIEDSVRDIDLLDAFKAGIKGADPLWVGYADDFRAVMTYRAAEELGDEEVKRLLDEKDPAIQKVAKEIAEGKRTTSKSATKEDLNKVIKGILGDDYNIATYDWKYMDKVFCSDKGKTSVATAKNRKNVRYLKSVCNRIITGAKGYKVVTDLVKED